MRDFVRRANRERGTTVLLTTHDMHDIEALAERVIVIGHGRVLADSPVEALRVQVLAARSGVEPSGTEAHERAERSSLPVDEARTSRSPLSEKRSASRNTTLRPQRRTRASTS